MTGVIGHIANPTRSQAVDLAVASEEAGARWIGLADAFWWRDVWMLLEAVAAATSQIQIGPAMTNPYMRHPFHTASALATLHEVAEQRVFCGITAGGSEVTLAASLSRVDAPTRTTELVQLLRAVSADAPLDDASGRTLDVELPPPPILMAARGPRMLRAAGATADRVLLWALPLSDLERSVEEIRRGAQSRDQPPELIWAPVVRHGDVAPLSLGHPAVYAALNSSAEIRASWGLDGPTIDAVRASLVRGELAKAIDMLPAAATEDLMIDPADSEMVVDYARRLGITEIAVPGFSVETVGHHLAWAAAVETQLS